MPSWNDWAKKSGYEMRDVLFIAGEVQRPLHDGLRTLLIPLSNMGHLWARKLGVGGEDMVSFFMLCFVLFLCHSDPSMVEPREREDTGKRTQLHMVGDICNLCYGLNCVH